MLGGVESLQSEYNILSIRYNELIVDLIDVGMFEISIWY